MRVAVCVQIPTIGFLYVAGYIGHVGRQYIIQSKEAAKPTEKEIIIDVPLAIKLALNGWAWPLATVQVRTRSDSAKDTAARAAAPPMQPGACSREMFGQVTGAVFI